MSSLLMHIVGCFLTNVMYILACLATRLDHSSVSIKLCECALASATLCIDTCDEHGGGRHVAVRRLNMRPITSWKELTGGDKAAMDALEEVCCFPSCHLFAKAVQRFVSFEG
jgi:hypothetical protein